ncbi:hypothetical protein ACIGEZ_02600 [Streptomyces sp. NPDC085481]|uniref:caspase, EACC1-associated type n=1 Tax=Streptomyces sp. NPDC085481 TaxID=3365727 RepID=UPI0037D79CBB
MTAALAAGGARAVLIGTGHHADGSTLPALPSVDTTLDDLQRALHEICGMAPEQVHRVPADAGQEEVVAAVERAVAEATGPLLLVYTGHGLLGPADELYLATRGSRGPSTVAGAVPYRTLKGLLGTAAAGSAVVLDCCFSGLAAVPAPGPAALDPFRDGRPSGSFLLSSASYFALSYAPEGERHTLFGGRLLGLLERGDPAGPRLLTLDHVAAALQRSLEGELAQPHPQSDGTLGRLVVAPNRAYRTGSAPTAEPPADVPCPYPGLESFRAEDSGYFHGRDLLTARLLAAVEGDGRGGGQGDGQGSRGDGQGDGQGSRGDGEAAAPAPPLVLVGDSGVGKSSLLRAGLLARLGDDRPALLLPAPGPHPLRALAALWARATGREEAEVTGELAEGRFPAPLPGRRPCALLAVDQFEEVFTRCEDADERARFIGLLTGGAGRPRVVLGLRADHYGSCLDHPGLESALAAGQLNVPPMSEDDLRSAVERPAAAAGLTLQDGLADRLLHDLRQGGGTRDALPFLAHALRETWLRRSGAVLTLAGYEETGGIWKSVTTTMDELYASLDEPGREDLRDLLLAMVHVTAVDGSADPVRRRIPTTGPDAPTALLDRLAAARLVTLDQDTAQIAHEALLRAWAPLGEWIEADRVELVLRRQVEEAADRWQAAGRDPSYLYQGSQLASVQLLAGRLRRPVDTEFLDAGRAAAGAVRARELRRTRRLQGALVAVALALCATLVAVYSAVQQRATAEEQRRLATYRAMRAEAVSLGATDPRTALRLGVAAYRLQPTAEARSALFDTLARTNFAGRVPLDEGSASTRVNVFGPGGRVLAADHPKDRTKLRLWNVAEAGAPPPPVEFTPCEGKAEDKAEDKADVEAVAFSPDGRILATSCEDGAIGLWSLARGLADVPDRISALRLPKQPGSAEAVRFSADGRTLGAVGWWRGNRQFGSLALWDVRDRAKPRLRAVREGVYDCAELEFGPDGRTLTTATGLVVFGSDPPQADTIVHTSGATLWDLADPARPKAVKRFERMQESIAYRPDGRLLALANTHEITLWDIATPARPRAVRSWSGAKNDVDAMLFRQDGKVLATGGGDDTAVLWNVVDPARPTRALTLDGHKWSVDGLAFSADARELVSYGWGEVIRWKATDRSGPTVVGAFDGANSVKSFDVSPDGRLVATGGFEERVDLWDFGEPRRPRRIASLPGHTAGVQALAFGNGGRALVSGDDEGNILFWDLTDRTRPRRVARLHRPEPVAQLAFSPLGTTVVSVEGVWLKGTARFWDVTDLSKPKEAGSTAHAGLHAPPRFRDDGKALALAGELGTFLWDLNPDSKMVELPTGHSPVAFSRDGRWLATGYPSDNTGVVLWNVEDLHHPRRAGAAPGSDGGLLNVEFHPQGNLLASANQQGDFTLWAVGERRLPHRVGVLDDHDETAQFARFTPDGRHLLTTDWSSLYVWDLDDFPELSADPVGRACTVAGGGLTEEEWSRYAPGLRYERTCGAS